MPDSLGLASTQCLDYSSRNTFAFPNNSILFGVHDCEEDHEEMQELYRRLNIMLPSSKGSEEPRRRSRHDVIQEEEAVDVIERTICYIRKLKNTLSLLGEDKTGWQMPHCELSDKKTYKTVHKIRTNKKRKHSQSDREDSRQTFRKANLEENKPNSNHNSFALPK